MLRFLLFFPVEWKIAMQELGHDLKMKNLKIRGLVNYFGDPNFTRHLNAVYMLKFLKRVPSYNRFPTQSSSKQ